MADTAELNWEYLLADGEEFSLRHRYREAVKSYHAFCNTSLHPFTDEYRSLHAKALRQLVECSVAISHANVFTPDLILDDIKTADLPFLFTNFFIAQVLDKTAIDPSHTSVDTRGGIVQLTARRYLELLALFDQLGLIKDSDVIRAVHDALPEGAKGKFNLTPLLNAKMRSGREKQSMDARLVESTLSKLASEIRATGMGDEGRLRDFFKMKLRCMTYDAFKAACEAAHELAILSSMSNALGVAPLLERTAPYVPMALTEEYVDRLAKESSGPTFDEAHDERLAKRESSQNSFATSSKRVDALGGNDNGRLLGKKGEINRPFVILPAGSASTMNRAQIQAQVFGTGQKLPTVDIDELVEKELANRVTSTTHQPAEALTNEDELRESDRETMKAREWDNFTEEVAKGSGNTLNLG